MDLLFDLVLRPFYIGTSKRNNLSGSNDLIASVEHALNVNKEKIVDMIISQFNYNLFMELTQEQNLPLPACK